MYGLAVPLCMICVHQEVLVLWAGGIFSCHDSSHGLTRIQSSKIRGVFTRRFMRSSLKDLESSSVSHWSPASSAFFLVKIFTSILPGGEKTGDTHVHTSCSEQEKCVRGAKSSWRMVETRTGWKTIKITHGRTDGRTHTHTLSLGFTICNQIFVFSWSLILQFCYKRGKKPNSTTSCCRVQFSVKIYVELITTWECEKYFILFKRCLHFSKTWI